jgi:predicted AAA+ superfamily ATPase
MTRALPNRQLRVATKARIGIGEAAAEEGAPAPIARDARVAAISTQTRDVAIVPVRISHTMSLQSAPMSRSVRRARIDRILELMERLLSRHVGDPPSEAVFRDTHAFRWDARRGLGALVPIPEPQRFELDDLIGVELARDRLLTNIEQFLAGVPSNHVLLYGERGTGKSSAVRGLLTRFAERGLRLIELHKLDLAHLPEVLYAIRGAPYRFLLFCDDLSFDEGETGYRELKAALEGSLESPPENVRIIATSNRRYLLPQKRSENAEVRVDEDGELHPGEALEEKLALADRFGLVLGFFSFNQDTYLAIVRRYLEKAGGPAMDGAIRADALRWALERSSRSGRTARQFVDDLLGKRALAGRSHAVGARTPAG